MISNVQWQNENEARAYPLSENATQVDNTGATLPMDLLTDLHLVLPPDYADAYVSSVWVTSNLFGLSLTHADGPLATATVSRAGYVPYTAIPLQPAPGVYNVSGWVSLGNYRFTVNRRWLFNSSAQSGLAERTKVLVDPLPVTSFRKLGGAADVFADKIVQLLGAGYLSVFPHEEDADTMVVELIPEAARSLFLGPCVELADRGDCNVPPLRQINGVCPDANGIITLVFE